MASRDDAREELEWSNEIDPEDVILESDSVDEAKFELICGELGNKNGRRILKEIANGVNTSTLIAERTGLTLQDVLVHLDKLVRAGMIEKSGKLPSLRGRRASVYRISHVAVLLSPNETANVSHLKEFLRRKALASVRRRMLATTGLTAVIATALFTVLLQSLATRKIAEGTYGTVVTIEYAAALPVALAVVGIAAPTVFLALRKLIRSVF
ncbi:MAG: winged helix-turn-helix transcriptional regulator [Nitrososphaerales archaeon]|jgi:DNA-binding MarR family transcriptional regulator